MFLDLFILAQDVKGVNIFLRPQAVDFSSRPQKVQQIVLSSTDYSFCQRFIQTFKFSSFHFYVMLQIGMEIGIKLVYNLVLVMNSRCIRFSSCDDDRFSIVFWPPQYHLFVEEQEEFQSKKVYKKNICRKDSLFSVALLILIRKTTMNKYRIISLEPLPLHNQRMSIKKLPEIRPRTLSMRCPTTNIQLPSKYSNIPPATEQKKTVRKMSALNLKQRPQLVSSNKTKRSQLVGFDNRILCNERSKSVKKAQQLPGLSRQVLVQRRQSHLNTYFNIRKNKLKQITKENKKIYVRINSQKSLYSSRHLNKSTDSMNESRMSKHSSRGSISSSRNTQKSKASLHKIPFKKKQIELKIESKDVNKLQSTQVNRYMKIFCNHLNHNIKVNEKAKTAKIHTTKGKQNGESIALGLSKILQQMDQGREVKKNFVFGRIL